MRSLTCKLSTKNASDVWLLDFACSHHMTSHQSGFVDFKEFKEVYTIDETRLTAHGIGSVRLKYQD